MAQKSQIQVLELLDCFDSEEIKVFASNQLFLIKQSIVSDQLNHESEVSWEGVDLIDRLQPEARLRC